MVGEILFVVSVDEASPDLLKKEVERARAAEREWRDRRLEEFRARFPGSGLSTVKEELNRELRDLRDRGVFWGTRDLLVARGLRDVLRERGLARDWPPVPTGDTPGAGRPRGAASGRHRPGSRGGPLSRQLPVRLPAELAVRVRRAAYWVSRDAVEALNRWEAEWGERAYASARRTSRGDGPNMEAILATVHPTPEQEALRERDRIRGRIVTTGDLIRESVARVISPAERRGKPENLT